MPPASGGMQPVDEAAAFPSPAGRGRASVASLGPTAFLTFITISNVISVGMFCAAWLVFCRGGALAPGKVRLRRPGALMPYQAACAGMYSRQGMRVYACTGALVACCRSKCGVVARRCAHRWQHWGVVCWDWGPLSAPPEGADPSRHPLATVLLLPLQLAQFAAVYSGMWGANQLSRPVRLAAAAAVTPAADVAVTALSHRLHRSKHVTVVVLLLLEAVLLLSALAVVVWGTLQAAGGGVSLGECARQLMAALQHRAG
jgi:hypothetical protein